jgi:tyrosyl-tRNA synthetase
MNHIYKVEELIEALKFNSVETLPNTDEALLKEVTILVDNANEYKQNINHYIGFEISGLVHIGTGLPTAMKIKKLTDAGVVCHIWLANFHTYLNNKLDGKLETIEKVRREYFEPCMRQCMEIVGCDMSKVVFLDAVTMYDTKSNDESFWMYDLDVCRNLTLSRILKSISVTGKKEGQEVDFALLRYPALQVADPYFLNMHIVHAGMDQRKCHVLMREIAYKLHPQHQLKIGPTVIKPIATHHSLLLSMDKPTDQGGEISKMSKSKPNSAIFVHDSEEVIANKVKKAYCPLYQDVGNTNSNPLLDWSRQLIFPANLTINISKLESTSLPKIYNNYQDLEQDYIDGLIYPTELKNAITETLVNWFTPLISWGNDNQDIINYISKVSGKK